MSSASRALTQRDYRAKLVEGSPPPGGASGRITSKDVATLPKPGETRARRRGGSAGRMAQGTAGVALASWSSSRANHGNAPSMTQSGATQLTVRIAAMI